MPSPADCTTSDVRTREEYDGPSASILRYRRSRNASFTRSAASVPKDAAERDVRYLTAQTANSVSNASSRLVVGMTTSSPWAVQIAHCSTLTSRFAIMNANSTSASSDSHRATTLAATSLPIPGVRENRRLSNTAHTSFLELLATLTESPGTRQTHFPHRTHAPAPPTMHSASAYPISAERGGRIASWSGRSRSLCRERPKKRGKTVVPCQTILVTVA